MIDLALTNFTCVRQPLDTTLSALASIGDRWRTPFDIVEINDHGFGVFTKEPIAQAVIWEPKSAVGTTVFTTNLSDGWGALGHCISKFFAFETARCRIGKGICEFRYLNEGKEQRLVRVLADPGWGFLEEGTPLKFEKLDQYGASSITARLRREDVEHYFASLGWAIRSPDFCTSEKPAHKLTEQSGFTLPIVDPGD